MIMFDLKNELNREQLLAVTHFGTPLMVLAGAGSGKTRVLTYRAYWLIKEKGVLAKEMALLTFTNKAAEEMKERVNSLLVGGANIGFAGTFHTFCARLLRRYGRALGIEPGYVIYDTSDQESAMKMAVDNLGLDPKRVRAKGVLSVIGKYKNDLISLTEARNLARDFLSKQTVDLWTEYQKLLMTHQALDFDDLLTRTVDLLKNDEINKKTKSEFGWILIDEYQDTNKAQFELTKLLVEKGERLTVVGDASQAIYSFRGADYRNLDFVKKFYQDLTVVKLEKNYRSTQKILDAAYGVINNNTNHPILRLETNEDGGEPITIFEAHDERDEADFVVRECQIEIQKGREVAILYRTNAQSRAFEEKLIKMGVAYKLVGGVRFYDRAEIKDLIAYLRVVVNPVDQVSWQRIEKMGKRKRDKFRLWLTEKKKELVVLTSLEILEQIVVEMEYLAQFDEKDEADRNRLENIKELMAVAGEYPELIDFLENIALVQADELADRMNEGVAKVTLMTIHSAKGLEFGSVFVVGAEEGLFPHSRSLLSKDDLEEERRLMYVAMTRAKKRLYLTLARCRLVFGGRQNNMPSRFLAEIPGHLLYKVNGNHKLKITNDKRTEEDGGRRIVQDWEVEIRPVSREEVVKLTVDDFAEIDSW
jgi:DNA helicase II / ATP-dependent DNA helicase PcrA